MHKHFIKYIHYKSNSVCFTIHLAAKISTSETSQLGSNPRYMSKLLSIVREKLINQIVDVTMKFTLSALWNLTGMNKIIFLMN